MGMCSWRLLGADGTEICDDGSALDEYARVINPSGDDRNQANARLIAASPDLLAALEALNADLDSLAGCDCKTSENHMSHIVRVLSMMRLRAEAAIKAAKG